MLLAPTKRIKPFIRIVLQGVSATSSNKSRLVLFLMVVISLAFLITSFLAAALTNDSAPSARGLQPQGSIAPPDQNGYPGPQAPPGSGQASDSVANYNGIHGDCFVFRTPDAKIYGECSKP